MIKRDVLQFNIGIRAVRTGNVRPFKLGHRCPTATVASYVRHALISDRRVKCGSRGAANKRAEGRKRSPLSAGSRGEKRVRGVAEGRREEGEG